ncbi:MAG: helix-turn-helix transcriptional regulator [Oscillospiraceae bacterium]|nr:helix-turn-helix transcriptional regulator [Oscillospiraceae bacterium]
MNVPERIQELRKQKGISQEELANELGISRQAVSKWESGQSFPELDNIIALSDYFGVSADHILKGTETPQVTKSRTPVDPKPKISLDDRIKRYIERRNAEIESEEKEVILQLAVTQKQRSVLAKVLYICSAAIMVLGAWILTSVFSGSDSGYWIYSLGIMLIGCGLYHVVKRLTLTEAPFTVKYINRASFAYAVVFLTAIHSALSYMDFQHWHRAFFATIYVLAAAIVYVGILLYRRYRKMQDEMSADLTQQSIK